MERRTPQGTSQERDLSPGRGASRRYGERGGEIELSRRPWDSAEGDARIAGGLARGEHVARSARRVGQPAGTKPDERVTNTESDGIDQRSDSSDGDPEDTGVEHFRDAFRPAPRAPQQEEPRGRLHGTDGGVERVGQSPIRSYPDAKAYLDAFDFTGTRTHRLEYYVRPPPEEVHMVFPPATPSMEFITGAKRKGPSFLFALAQPRDGGSPLILSAAQGDHQQHISGVTESAGSTTVKHRTAGILGIMSWLQRRPHQLPPTLCLNCFTHHLPHVCRDVPRNFRALIEASEAVGPSDPRYVVYPACKSCGTVHPPERGVCNVPMGLRTGHRQ